MKYRVQEFESSANRLLRQATRITLSFVLSYAFFGAIVGIGAKLFLLDLLQRLLSDTTIKLITPYWNLWTVVPAFAALVALFGYRKGKLHAADLELDAQRTLCQIRTEQHLANIVEMLSEIKERPAATPIPSESSKKETKPVRKKR